jgi:threonine aldolase
VSITQTTELGTCYTPEEVRAITEHAHSLGMRVHLDGARISNAAATLGTPISEFTGAAGVDVVSLGGTKNGALAAEAVVVVDPELAADPTLGLVHVRKLSMQLASKMRFVSAQLLALYDGDLWLRSAAHANAMAARLAAGVEPLAGVTIQRPVQANAVFAVLDRDVANALRERFRFYDWDAATGEVRWMCSWDTTEADVDAFVTELTRLLRG